MNHTELTDASQISYRFNLRESPTLQYIQRLFNDLYVCSRLDPGYLFLAEREYALLRGQIIGNSNIRCRPEDVDDMLSRMGHRLFNETTGNLVHLVMLPGLEYGAVIVGFFR